MKTKRGSSESFVLWNQLNIGFFFFLFFFLIGLQSCQRDIKRLKEREFQLHTDLMSAGQELQRLRLLLREHAPSLSSYEGSPVWDTNWWPLYIHLFDIYFSPTPAPTFLLPLLLHTAILYIYPRWVFTVECGLLGCITVIYQRRGLMKKKNNLHAEEEWSRKKRWKEMLLTSLLPFSACPTFAQWIQKDVNGQWKIQWNIFDSKI